MSGNDDYFAAPPSVAPSELRHPPGWTPRPPKRRRVTAERVSLGLTDLASSWLMRGVVVGLIPVAAMAIRAVWPG